MNEKREPNGTLDSTLLRGIVNGVVDGILAIDEQGIVRLINPAAECLFGYRADEVLGHNIKMLMPEPYHSEHDQYLQNYLTTGHPKIIGIGREVEGRRKDGSTFPMRLSVADVRLSEHRWFAGIVHDLTERKGIEAALRESEDRFRDFTEAASDWAWEMDENLRFTQLTERFSELTGIAADRVLGRTRWELAADDGESEKWQWHRKMLEQQLPFRDFVYRTGIADRDGRKHYFRISGKPVYDAAGRFTGYRGTGADTTDQARVERALRESQRMLSNFMANLPGMAYRCAYDRTWTMEFVSSGSSALTGYHPEELVKSENIAFGVLVLAADWDAAWAEIQSAVSEGRAYQVSYRIKTAANVEKWVLDQGCGVFGTQGEAHAREGILIDITERKQTEVALRALAESTAVASSDEFFRNCVRDLARTYSARYAFTGIFKDESKSSIRTLAVWAGDGFAENFEYILAGTPCSDILDRKMELVTHDVVDRYPEDIMLADMGAESYFGAPLVSSTGNIMGLVSVLDIKPMPANIWARPVMGIFANRMALELERRQAEERVRRSEEQLRLTLQNAPIGIVTADLKGNLLGVNPAFCDLLGYSSRELGEMSIKDITHPDDLAETLERFHALVRGDIRSFALEKNYLRKDGSVVTGYARAGLVRDSQGRPLLVVGQVEDITERQRAAQEMRRMRSYLENIIDSMPSVLVGVDIDGNVTEWNRSAEDATGVPAAEAKGQRIDQLLPQLAPQLDKLREAIRNCAPVRMERLTMEQQGETRHADVMIYPLLAHEAVGAVIRVDDVTDRVRIEQTMVQTEKMMSVGGLAAGMAHEINNPLSGVLQGCQNILRRISLDLPANWREAESLEVDLEGVFRYLDARGILRFVAGMQDAATRASRIVADMLAFSRRTASEFAYTTVDEMLDTVVRLAASDYDLDKQYDFKQIEIVRDFDSKLGPVYCDRTEIEQVFLNLLKNAAQAMARGGMIPYRIVLRTRRDETYARIEVEDNGPGMDEETERRVFEPFFTTKPPGVGTGLGLSVSFFIVTEQHNGTITVSSEPGNGACFVIRLPLAGRSPGVV